MMLSWEFLFAVGAVILLFGLIYGVWQYRSRDRSLDPVRDRVVEDRYEHPEKHDG